MAIYKEFLQNGGEKKWQDKWEKEEINRAEDYGDKPKKYVLDMFPYPSAAGLHVGHPEGYTATDIYSRYFRLRGFNVLHPMGWDAFGLPAENYAIKTGTQPKIITEKNVETFKRQIMSLGFSYDWSREVNTTDPNYYKWTQWIFLQLFKKGLAYEATVPINWCPSCLTGLANEEVKDGKCDRCGTEVVKKDMRQWMLRITSYADRLLSGLDNLDWSESIKSLQRNWIGRSEGINFKQKIKDLDIEFEVYDSIPQTFIAQTFTVIAPEHPMVEKLIAGTEFEKPVKEFVKKIAKRKMANKFDLEKEMEGIFTGRYVENPFGTGDLPIWIASYVIVDYGTGIVNCSAHDERDFAFAKKYDIPLKIALLPEDAKQADRVKNLEEFYREPNGIMQEPIEFKGMKWYEAREPVIDYIEKHGLGQRTINYKLRDWVFSRQRYWGEPIPLIYCENCKKQKQKVLIIHGWEATGEGNWFSWMKNELEKNGFEVFNPTMTTSANPNIDKWIEELTPYIEKMGESDIIIGHSLGSNAALRLIEKTGKKIGNLFLVGSAIGKLPEETWKLWTKEMPGSDIKSLREFWEGQPINWNKVTELVANKNIILSDDDPYITPDTHKDLPQGWNFEIWHGHKHFTVIEAPEILKKVLACKSTGWIPVPESELPLTLPEVDKYEPTGTGESPLINISDWVKAKCPVCGGEAHRETNTMPQWAGSSWYWLRFIDPKNEKIFADFEKLKYWMPVDVYVGGAEHAVLHLLYGRFWNMVLFDLGYVPQEEPFTKLVNQGMILAENGEKMSKSKGNVINPDDQVRENGADAFRMYEMFMGPLEDTKPWNTKGIIGISRFLEKVWNMVDNYSKDEKLSADQITVLNKTIKKVGEDIENMRFNTAISAMMVLVNESKGLSKEFLEKFLIILAPFAPHMAEELWEKLGHKKSIFKEVWPIYDESKIIDEEVELVVQINGKVRAKLKLATGTSEADAIAKAKEDENVKKYLDGVEIKKTIFVANKLISFVI